MVYNILIETNILNTNQLLDLIETIDCLKALYNLNERSIYTLVHGFIKPLKLNFEVKDYFLTIFKDKKNSFYSLT